MKKRWLGILLALCLLVCFAPAAFAAEVPAPESNAVYVNADGNDQSGQGTQAAPYASLAKAVDALKGKTGEIYLLSDVTASSLALVDGDGINPANITVYGNSHTIKRSVDFAQKNDARGGYNPAMIEVANGSTLTLYDITLDDAFKHHVNATVFDEQINSDDYRDTVQDAIIAAYHGGGTITLGEGTTLKNFGGMSAVRVGGQVDNPDSSKLIMEAGSQIIDDMPDEARDGGFGAIWSQGGIVEVQEDASIHGIDGRAMYLEDGATATVNGSIYDITSNETMRSADGGNADTGGGGALNGFGGIVFAIQRNSSATLGETGTVYNIQSHDNTANDVLIWGGYGSRFTMEKGSSIVGTAGDVACVMDSDGMDVSIDGTIRDFNSKSPNTLIRTRNNDFTFTFGKNSIVENCSSNDAAVMYIQGASIQVNFNGVFRNITTKNRTTSTVFIAHTAGNNATCTFTGTMEDIEGSGLYISKDTSKLIVDGGTIRNCSGYAIKVDKQSDSCPIAQIKNGSVIENNNNGSAQVVISAKDAADNTHGHVEIAAGTIIGNKTIDSTYWDVILSDNYKDVQLGDAKEDAENKIEELVKAKYPDWTAVSYCDLWIRPSTTEYSFLLDPLLSPKKTGLFVAYIPLNEDGTPQDNASVIIDEVANEVQVPITLKGLTVGTSYAVMLFNNAEYTVAPDDITIYTGGGQGTEGNYETTGGFPKLTINNSVDLTSTGDLTSLEIKGDECSATGEATLLDQLMALLEVTYTDADGNEVTNDQTPGEYTAELSLVDGYTTEDIKVNSNEINLDGEGTLIVRHTEDISGATSGGITHALLAAEPTEPVSTAVAIAKKSSSGSDPLFYLNNDTSRSFSNTGGVQILDDKLLTDDDGTDRQALLEAKAAEYLGAPGEGQTYLYDFHYLDLVDAHNGNAWVAASYGTTVYLPYPEGVTKDTAIDLSVKVVHFKGLHREYGISGQADVEEAIENCQLETMKTEFTDAGIKFDTERAGFSPFAIVWQTKAHTITATAGAGGSINPNGAVVVAEGADKTFTITPSNGYQIADVKVDGTSVGAVSTYTFTDVQGNHTIEATFKPKSTYIPPVQPADPDDTGVSDLLNTEDHIQYLFGYPDGTFAPENNMTRAEVAQMFYNLLLDQDVTITKTFDDVPANAWYTKAVNTLASLDIISGVGDNKFEPERSITRAEFTAMAMKFAVGGEEGENIFSDVDENDWFYDAVVNSIQYGWIHGYGDGTFRPNNPITRAEVTAIVNNMLGRAADEDFVDEHAEELTQFSDIEKHWAYYHIVEATNDHDYTKPSSGENWTKLN